MKKKEKYEVIIIIIVIILMPILFFEEVKIKEEKQQQLDDIADSYFKLYEIGRMTIKDIEFALDSFNEKDRNYIHNKLIEKGVPLDEENNNEKDNK